MAGENGGDDGKRGQSETKEEELRSKGGVEKIGGYEKEALGEGGNGNGDEKRNGRESWGGKK